MKPEKRFNLWDIEGTAFIEDHKEGSYHIGKTEDVDINSLRNITKRLNIYADENEQLKIKLEDIALDMENAKESNDDAQQELYKLKKENEKLKKGMIEVVDRYIRNVEHNPPSSARTYLKVKGALVNVREGLRDLLGDLE